MNKSRSKILNLLLVVLIMVFITSTSILLYFSLESISNEKYIEELRKQMVVPERDEKVLTGENQSPIEDYIQARLDYYSQLQQQNADMIGWIRVQNLEIIDYPVMYHPLEKDYYLKRGFDGLYNPSGLPYVQEDCNPFGFDDNVIIYGHHLKDGTMFTQLLKYKDYGFYQEHRYIYFDTVNELHVYEIFACFSESVNTGIDKFEFYEMTHSSSAEEFNNYIEKARKMSYIDCDVNVNYGDKIITLVTCDFAFDDGRCVVMAVRVD